MIHVTHTFDTTALDLHL